MNYYEHHLGDWAAATGHLTWDEDMAYTRLLRAYYHFEKPIAQGQQYRMAKASTPAQRKAVDAVLTEFFVLQDGLFRQKRADAEIERFQDKQRKAKASANARWSQSVRNANASQNNGANAMRTHSEGNAHQTPDTRHQAPDPIQDQEPTHTNPSPREAPVCVESHRVTTPIEVVKALKDAGLDAMRMSASNPTLVALVDAGASIEEFVSGVGVALEKSEPFAYLLGKVKGQRKSAKDTADSIAKGVMPPLRQAFPTVPQEPTRERAPPRWRVNAARRAVEASGHAADIESREIVAAYGMRDGSTQSNVIDIEGAPRVPTPRLG